MTLTLSWRGPLDSCNYRCAYCPFAKKAPRAATLAADRAALARFVAWVEVACRGVRVRFIPYGEALVYAWYVDAITRLAALPHVEAVSIQTNGSARPEPLGAASDKVTLWVSYHPTEVGLGAFVERCLAWRARGVRLAVGAVAEPAHEAAIVALRAALPADWPLWLNAKKPGRRYGPEELARWTALDPDFPQEARPLRSRGLACRSGETGLVVGGDGTLTRCVLVPEVLGNLYADDLDTVLRPRTCPRATCTCWLGYSQSATANLRTMRG